MPKVWLSVVGSLLGRGDAGRRRRDGRAGRVAVDPEELAVAARACRRRGRWPCRSRPPRRRRRAWRGRRRSSRPSPRPGTATSRRAPPTFFGPSVVSAGLIPPTGRVVVIGRPVGLGRRPLRPRSARPGRTTRKPGSKGPRCSFSREYLLQDGTGGPQRGDAGSWVGIAQGRDTGGPAEAKSSTSTTSSPASTLTVNT